MTDAPRASAITSVDDLVAWHLSAVRAPADYRLGTEYERLCVGPSGDVLPYDGPVSIRALLEALARDFGWQRVFEGDRLIALQRGQASVTLEPAGQLELSGAPLATVAAMCAERDEHLAELQAVAEPLGVRFAWVGMNPLDTPETAAHMPKERYGRMRAWMPTVGSMGLDMMHLTCTVQINVDFANEADAMRKWRLGMLLTPALIGLFANSPWRYGVPAQMASARAHVWTDVDPARCDPGPMAFDPATTLRDYVDWALDVAMYFVQHAEHGASGTRKKLDFPDHFRFSDFMASGHGGRKPTLDDWELHVGTLFPDARLKRYLELRAADCVPPRLLSALPALGKGIFYDATALTEALALCRDGDESVARVQARADACTHGLDAVTDGWALRDVAVEVLAAAQRGLARQAAATGADVHAAAELDELVAIAKGDSEPLWAQTAAKLQESPTLLAVCE